MEFNEKNIRIRIFFTAPLDSYYNKLYLVRGTERAQGPITNVYVDYFYTLIVGLIKEVDLLSENVR